MVPDKITRGLLRVVTEAGPHYVKPSLVERLRLIWIFRNFPVVPQQVLTLRQRRLISSLCTEERLYQGWTGPGQPELIGTLVNTVLPESSRSDDRRASSRSSFHFEVMYGIHKELVAAEGCDFGGGGLAFIGPVQYPPGTELELRYRLEPTAGWTSVRALVRHCQSGRTGVEFLCAPGRLRANASAQTPTDPKTASVEGPGSLG